MASHHNHSAVSPAIWDLAKLDKHDSSIIRCIIKNKPECEAPIKLCLGGESVLKHFSECHGRALQFIENAILQTCCVLPLDKESRKVVLSIIPNEKALLTRSIDDIAGQSDPAGFAHYTEPSLYDALNLEDSPPPPTLQGAIAVYRRGSVTLW